MPFLAGWNYRKPIRYGATIPGSNLTDFPLLLAIVDDADIGAVLSSRKFAVTEADGETEVPYGHYNNFNVSGGECTFTLRAKFDLDSGAAEDDVIGYLYYDNSATDQSDRAGSLPSSRVGFWPLEEDPSGSSPQIIDWVGDNNLTTSGSMDSGDLITGQVAKGLSLDANGKGAGVAASTSLKLGWPATISLWYKSIGSPSPNVSLVGLTYTNSDSSPYIAYGLGVEGSGTSLRLEGNSGGTFQNAIFSLDPSVLTTWCHLVAVWADTSTRRVYLNGVEQGGVPSGTWNNPNYGTTPLMMIGNQSYITDRNPNAHQDEVSIDSVALSEDWIVFAYENESDNAATVTLGAQETGGGASGQPTAKRWGGVEFASSRFVQASGMKGW